MPKSAFDPIRIPEQVWDREENRAILKSRNISELFKIAAKYGASQTRLSTATGITQGRISLIIRGQRQVTDLEVFERIAAGLGLPDHARMLFGLAPLDTASPTGNRDGVHQEQAEELAARIEEATVVDSTMVMILTTDTNNLRLMDRRAGAAAIADKMRAQITQIERFHRHAIRPGIRAQLARIMSETAALAGWQAIDTCALSDAWDHHERAISAAREAEDPALIAYARGQQAYVLVDLGRPAEATELLQHIRTTYDRHVPDHLRTWLAAAEAEAAAILGDETTCRTALDQAAALLPQGGADPTLPYVFLDKHHLARWRGNCLVRFGDPDTIEDLQSALAGMDGTYNRAEAGLRCDLAHAFLAMGEADAAHPHLHRAQQLVTLTGSRRHGRRVKELTRAATRALR
ncbi:transcriptional regulator with XRE-family HTH domain [Streptosporangium becharense]|uniref:Transcriptional regulator with XRE-family HTH domain n=1 Tax=Streptosporangium becharense TaxID=1816182 RepID=A0A7W9IGP4_9ACTN|nr:helix-turn-helix transcriptional regulator [Streptosporangium becharense]MBB2914817.1 transcriptional regulator with XRE-family HTH domain [Streptosporangium becharense]MBB5820372.1 transcriptional regulator with XRE-family HTH domain [Streptosporangium becharense]